MISRNLKNMVVHYDENHLIWRTHSVEKREILSHWKYFSSNQLFSSFFSKTIDLTKFLRKKSEREFLQFPHCAHTVKITEFDCHNFVAKIPSNELFYKKKNFPPLDCFDQKTRKLEKEKITIGWKLWWHAQTVEGSVWEWPIRSK